MSWEEKNLVAVCREFVLIHRDLNTQQIFNYDFKMLFHFSFAKIVIDSFFKRLILYLMFQLNNNRGNLKNIQKIILMQFISIQQLFQILCRLYFIPLYSL